MRKTLKVDNDFIPCPADVGDELYPNGIFEFNITQILDHIHNNSDSFTVEEVMVSDFSANFSSINESHLDSVDISVPVIMAEIAPGKYNLIDGNHRMEKARRMGVKTILAYKLSVEQHMKFLTNKRAYVTYVEYWNSKLKIMLMPGCSSTAQTNVDRKKKYMITHDEKNIAADLASVDDMTKQWPKSDLLLSLGFPVAARKNLCRWYWEKQDNITLAEVFELVLSSHKDPRPGYLISKMLDIGCIGKMTFLSVVRYMGRLDFGIKCNLVWKNKYQQFANAHRVRGNREGSWSFPITDSGEQMAKFRNGSQYTPRRRKKI